MVYAVPKPPHLDRCDECDTPLFAAAVVQQWLQDNRDRVLVTDRARLAEILERNPELTAELAAHVGASSTPGPERESGAVAVPGGAEPDLARGFPDVSSTGIPAPFVPIYGTFTCKVFNNVHDAQGRTGSISVETFIVSHVSSRSKTTRLGVKFTCTMEDLEEKSTGEIPFDELPEAVIAFDTIAETGSHIADRKDGYTELFYDTTTKVRYGFSQTVYGQTPFIQLAGGPPLYMTVEQFFELRDAVDDAWTKLNERRSIAGTHSSETAHARLRHIFLAAHPAFVHLGKIIDAPFRVFFTNESELDACLGVQEWDRVGADAMDDDSRAEWINEAGTHYLKLRAALFDSDGRLRPFDDAEWRSDYLEICPIERSANDEG